MYRPPPKLGSNMVQTLAVLTLNETGFLGAVEATCFLKNLNGGSEATLDMAQIFAAPHSPALAFKVAALPGHSPEVSWKVLGRLRANTRLPRRYCTWRFVVCHILRNRHADASRESSSRLELRRFCQTLFSKPKARVRVTWTWEAMVCLSLLVKQAQNN